MLKPKDIAPPAAEIRARLLALAAEFERVTGMSPSRIGKRAVNDTNFLWRVQAGGNFTLRKYRRLTDYIESNWPADTVPAADNRGGRRNAKAKSA